jgi:hypothetical protein
MVAWQRTHITRREERGIGPISFKRLLLAGGLGAAVAMIGSRTVGFLPGCSAGGLLLAVGLALTHPREGMPLASRLVRTARGLAVVAAVHGEAGWGVRLAQALSLTPQDGLLDADRLYEASPSDTTAPGLLDGEWAYLGGFPQADEDGLSATGNPFRREVSA